MEHLVDARIAVVIPNWNGVAELPACLRAMQRQTQAADVIVVENGSTDGSVELLRNEFPYVTALLQPKNLGFAGGVNVGIRHAIAAGYDYIALLNNDAIADERWLAALYAELSTKSSLGIVTSKMIDSTSGQLDDIGEQYTTWGLAFALGRGDPVTSSAAMTNQLRFGASGGTSLYRTSMLTEIGLFDEDFFAYYEDIDISWRAQLRGWKVRYVADAVVLHHIGATSSRIKGFVTFQAIKNYPWLLIRNVRKKHLKVVLPRFVLAYALFIARAILRGHGVYAVRGLFASLSGVRKKLTERRNIQSQAKVTDEYIWSIMTHDLPPDAYNLRTMRRVWWKITGKT